MRTFISLVKAKISKFNAALGIILARCMLWLSRKMRRVVFAYFLSRLIATFVYSEVESWRWQEALWWSGVAAQTIGYGDLAPKTDHGRFLAEFFHSYWVFYTLPLIAGHVVIYLFKNSNIFTHEEQEWILKTLRIIFDWQRWCVMTLQMIGKRMGLELPKPPHRDENDNLVECDPEPADTDYDETLVQGRLRLKTP